MNSQNVRRRNQRLIEVINNEEPVKEATIEEEVKEEVKEEESKPKPKPKSRASRAKPKIKTVKESVEPIEAIIEEKPVEPIVVVEKNTTSEGR